MRANRVIEQVRAVLLRDGAGLTDGQLLDCFIAGREDAAFEALVRRHGPMVLAVCRRVLRNHHDSEDAFQATFLVLARKAASVVPREMVGNWLYGVAYRTALKAKAVTAKRGVRERQVIEMPEPEAPQEDTGRDLQRLLDQELKCLPEKYRVPLVLCGLEGKSEKEAARQLGWPQGTLSGRLSRARTLLASRLAQRGLVLSAGSLTIMLSRDVSSACVRTTLLASTVKAARLYVAGQAVGTSVVSAEVAALTEGVLTAMLLSKLKVATLVLLIVVGAVLSSGTFILSVSRAKDKDVADPTPVQTPKEIVGEITLAEISAAYGRNDALGDEKFTGKQLRVTGNMFIIRRASSGGHSQYWLTMSDKRSVVYTPVFKFNLDYRKQLAELKNGQELTIQGQCEGSILEAGQPRSGPEFGGAERRIEFSNCKIISVHK